jgi:hypothetical protein
MLSPPFPPVPEGLPVPPLPVGSAGLSVALHAKARTATLPPKKTEARKEEEQGFIGFSLACERARRVHARAEVSSLPERAARRRSSDSRYHPAMYRLLSALVFGALVAGCDVDTDAVVFVDPSISAPSATVDGSTLGTSLSGGFGLELHLGPRASGASQVTIGQFSIQGSDQKTTIVSPLEVTADKSFPVTVDVDSDVDVAFTFDTGAKLLEKEKAAELCPADGIIVSGVIQDSLQDGATPVYSAAFHASGCTM